jgi:hypothetical protein
VAVQLCARARRWEELRQIASEALAAQAARDVTLSVDFHDLLIRLARRAGDWRLALRSYHAMAVAGVAPTAATLSMLVAVLVAAGQGDEARRVVQQIRGAHALPVGQLNVQVRMDGERVIGVLKKKRTPGITEPHSSTVSFSLSREERRHARGESGHLSSHCGVGWRWRDGCNTHGTRSWSVEFNRFRVGPGCLHAARVSATPHALGVRRRAPLSTGCRTAAVVEGCCSEWCKRARVSHPSAA